MGKYTKKVKIMADIALTSVVSQLYLGVRTRTKTLALRRRPAAAAPPPSKPAVCYLGLRSRRHEKTTKPYDSPNTREEDGEISKRDESERERSGIEAPFEENCLDFDVRERSTRESSPCSSSRGAGTKATLSRTSSTTNRTWSTATSHRVHNTALLTNAYAPAACELEEFFAREEKFMQCHFIDKYNFDVVGDLPVPGRYEWVAVRL